MKRVDRNVGLALALLALAVLWSARDFPAVPGQKLGAGFLPMLVGVGLLLCGLGLLRRSLRTDAATAAVSAAGASAQGSVWPAVIIMASVAAYVLAAERLGFLIVAPLMLLACFRALGVGWRGAVLWALGGTLVVHLAFYKLLRVPLPWGLLRPLY